MNTTLLAPVRFVCLDMDGTIYRGSQLFPCTIPFLDFLTGKGIRYAFLTNNSSVGKFRYVEKLRRMGIDTDADHFYTSIDYAVDYLKQEMPQVRKLYLLATPECREEFEAAGYAHTEADPDALMVAFDKTLTYETLCKAAYFLKKGIPAFATHPDVFCPTDKEEWLVDCGAIIAALETSTGCKLHVLGKPDPGMLKRAAARVGITDMRQIMMIGDRLSTDVALGVRAGAVSCRILDPTAEVTHISGIAPDFSVTDLAGLQKIWQVQENSPTIFASEKSAG